MDEMHNNVTKDQWNLAMNKHCLIPLLVTDACLWSGNESNKHNLRANRPLTAAVEVHVVSVGTLLDMNQW
jgi:hypothetical protein